MDNSITDTDRLNFLAEKIARAYGSEPGDFRDHIDMQIRAVRTTQSAWIELTVDFPADNTPIFVEASDEREGVVCYCPIADNFYLHCPGKEIHGRLWSEVYGPRSEILRWHPVKG